MTSAPTNPSPDVVIVGAGAAGLFAARSAAMQGANVLLLEKTARIGTKILVSGGGKCNIAHAGPLEEVIGAFEKSEAVFIRPSCYRMRNDQIMAIFEKQGMKLQARANGRVFPVDATAKDVLNILIQEVTSRDVRICLNTAVKEIIVTDGQVEGVQVRVTQPKMATSETTGRFGTKALLQKALRHESHEGDPWDGPSPIPCKKLIVCCGGSSYPNSGTTGDGWKWARDLGHSVVRPRAALAPIYLEKPFIDLSGVALPGCRLMARLRGKRSAESVGDLLFTHQGISGPVVLMISRQVALLTEEDSVTLEVDLKPEQTFDQIIKQLDGNGTLARWLTGYAWESVVKEILTSLALDGERRLSQLSKRDKNRVAETLKGWAIGVVKTVPLEKGEVTAGGISLAEVEPKTMRSKLISGLYLAGEILDVAGPVGGYNLQAAFATGHVAGLEAALTF